MNPRMALLLTLVFTSLQQTAVVTAAAPKELYTFETEIPIGEEGGWDYLSVDEHARRLYVTHATRVAVIDLETHKVIGTITNTPGVHGFAIAPELHRGFSSDGRDSKVSIVDLTTLKTLSRVSTGVGPDAILFEPKGQEVYSFNGRGKSVTIIKAASGEVVTTLPLLGQPEFAVADTEASRVFCNIEDKSEVVSIDTSTHQILKRWSIAPGDSPSGLAFDKAHHRLIVGCHNNLMLLVNSDNGKVVSSVPIGAGVDANVFDPETQLAFSSCGDGTVTIAHEVNPDKLEVVQTLKTEKGAKTMTLDPKTHRIYLASAKYETPPAAAPGTPAPRRVMVPNSFKVLVYRLEK